MNSNLTRSFAALYKILRLSNIYIYIFSKKKTYLCEKCGMKLHVRMGLKTKGMKEDKFPPVLELDVHAEENTAKK